MSRTNVTVLFVDPNGKEIERVQHRTNDYGSFSGSVTAPRDRVAGQMLFRVESGTFDLDDIAAAICEKLIRRHPHVFGESTADTPEGSPPGGAGDKPPPGHK